MFPLDSTGPFELLLWFSGKNVKIVVLNGILVKFLGAVVFIMPVKFLVYLNVCPYKQENYCHGY